MWEYWGEAERVPLAGWPAKSKGCGIACGRKTTAQRYGARACRNAAVLQSKAAETLRSGDAEMRRGTVERGRAGAAGTPLRLKANAGVGGWRGQLARLANERKTLAANERPRARFVSVDARVRAAHEVRATFVGVTARLRAACEVGVAFVGVVARLRRSRLTSGRGKAHRPGRGEEGQYYYPGGCGSACAPRATPQP